MNIRSPALLWDCHFREQRDSQSLGQHTELLLADPVRFGTPGGNEPGAIGQQYDHPRPPDRQNDRKSRPGKCFRKCSGLQFDRRADRERDGRAQHLTQRDRRLAGTHAASVGHNFSVARFE